MIAPVLALAALLPVRRAIYGEGDADRGFNPRDGGATSCLRVSLIMASSSSPD